MRYLGLDLGTKTLGVAITDKTKTIARVLKVIHFKNEDYDTALKEVIKIVEEYNIKKIALGLPKNMNNSYGFASERSLKFKEKLEELIDIPIILIDERLSTIEAENILLSADISREKRKKVIDGIAAEIILETLIKKEENNE
jgi:putative Holliday junction resolvase